MLVKARLTGLFLASLTSVLCGQEERSAAKQELAKSSQNPLGSLVSVPFENSFFFDLGPSDSVVFASIAKPVYPIPLGDYNLINRFIVPFIHDEGQDASDLSALGGQSSAEFGDALVNLYSGSDTGVGNITYQGFLTSAAPSKWILGAGPVMNLPTHTSERFGTDKLSAGPACIVLAMPGRWVVGSLYQQLWDVAGSNGAAGVNQSSLQFFVNYNLDAGWYLSTSPLVTMNWEADSGEQLKLPIGGGVGKLHRFGGQSVDFRLVAYKNCEQTRHGPEYEVTFSIKFLFPR
ncbi:MAG: hypothetical protein ACON39_07815 [Coraliomargaritaceae bacterium]